MKTITEITPNEGFLVTADRFPERLILLQSEFRDERGQTFAEYGLILALVVLVGVASLSTFGSGLSAKMIDTFNAVITNL